MTGSLVVLVRILMGWLGVFLVAHGLPAPLVDLLANDPALHDAVAEMAGQLIGGALMVAQLIWWQLAKRLGWTT